MYLGKFAWLTVRVPRHLRFPTPTEKCAQGVSSRVEGVSSRMSLRAKDMLASVGDDPDGNVNSRGGSPVSLASPNGSQRNGEGTGTVDGSVAAGSARNGSLRRFFQSNGGGGPSSASGILNGIASEGNTPPSASTVDEAEVTFGGGKALAGLVSRVV